MLRGRRQVTVTLLEDLVLQAAFGGDHLGPLPVLGQELLPGFDVGLRLGIDGGALERGQGVEATLHALVGELWVLVRQPGTQAGHERGLVEHGALRLAPGDQAAGITAHRLVGVGHLAAGLRSRRGTVGCGATTGDHQDGERTDTKESQGLHGEPPRGA